eukprot:TRINITY_DN9909_c0_g1_i3.p1 TRINITY_DN9909_c0_g1~~TRINITY_DN9909_c0_g1_i3.p1  ORF type:complete len:402 (-),score=91.31 TRINITY_DN9909_c0_g1_i3:638-1843(-)
MNCIKQQSEVNKTALCKHCVDYGPESDPMCDPFCSSTLSLSNSPLPLERKTLHNRVKSTPVGREPRSALATLTSTPEVSYESRKTLQRVYTMCDFSQVSLAFGPGGFLTSDRHLIREGDLLTLGIQNESRQCHFWLFEDVLMFGGSREDIKQRCRLSEVIPLEQLKVDRLFDDDHSQHNRHLSSPFDPSCAFQIEWEAKDGTEKTLLLLADNIPLKAAWVKAIRDALQNIKPIINEVSPMNKTGKTFEYNNYLNDYQNGSINATSVSKNQMIRRPPPLKSLKTPGMRPISSSKHEILIEDTLPEIMEENEKENTLTDASVGFGNSIEIDKLRTLKPSTSIKIKRCMLCSELFNSITRRRRECDNCHSWVCKNCCKHTMVLPEINPSQPVKICDACVEQMDR